MFRRIQNKLFWWEYQRMAKKNPYLRPQREFDRTMWNVDSWLDFIKDKRGVTAQIAVLDFLIDAIKMDLQSSGLNGLFYSATLYKSTEVTDLQDALFAISSFCRCEVKQQIDSYGKTVIASPWNHERLCKAIIDIKENGFHSEYQTYSGVYYPELKMIVVENGQHHSAVAAQRGEYGIFHVDICHLSSCFEDVSTDGEFWLSKKQPGVKARVYDVRMAILYELARRKHLLKEDMRKTAVEDGREL